MSKPKTTPPTVEPDSMHGHKYTHPSYGVIKISRVSGETTLFDSDFQHQHFISLSVCKAAKYDDGHHSMIHEDHGDDGRSIVEVYMSEAQFARAITSMNMGSGSPCTLNRVHNKSVPLPEAEQAKERHIDGVNEKLSGAMNKQREIVGLLERWRSDKHRPTLKEMDELIMDLGCATDNFKSNMEYYGRCFEEHMEKVVLDAKTEIETHILATTERLGVQDKPSIEFGGDDVPTIDVT